MNNFEAKKQQFLENKLHHHNHNSNVTNGYDLTNKSGHLVYYSLQPNNNFIALYNHQTVHIDKCCSIFFKCSQQLHNHVITIGCNYVLNEKFLNCWSPPFHCA